MSSDKVSAAKAIKGMFSFLTMLPINVENIHVESMNKKFWLVPIVGLFYAILATAVFGLTYQYVSPIIAAALTMLIVGLMNRFLHFDGLIDVGDGLTVAGKQEDHVRALKDSLVGAGGVATGILVSLFLFSEYVSLDIVGFMIMGFSAELLARNSQVACASFGNPGDGMASDSVRYTTKGSLVKSSILSLILLAGSLYVLRYLAVDVFNWVVPDILLYSVIAGFIVSLFWGWLMSGIAKKNFGIVNGDVLGATNETSRVVILFVMIVTVSVYGLI